MGDLQAERPEGRTIREQSPVKSSGSNGDVEHAVQGAAERDGGNLTSLGDREKEKSS